MAFSLLFVFHLIAWTNVPLVLAQNNCDRYCFKSCDDYWPGWEFSECEKANTFCPCSDIEEHPKPAGYSFMLFVILGCIIFALFCCGMCFRYITWKERRRQEDSNRPRQYPFIAEFKFDTDGMRAALREGRILRSSSHSSINSSVNQRSGQFEENPESLAAPQSKNRASPEYIEPPPPYNDCVRDANFESETERLLK